MRHKNETRHLKQKLKQKFLSPTPTPKKRVGNKEEPMRLQSFRLKGISWIAATGLTVAGLLIGSTQAIAAERVVMRYGSFERSASVEELTHFVETGETTRQLRAYFRMSGQDPEQFRQLLSREVEVDVVTLDRLLNNPVGDVMLDQMGRFVHTPSGDTNREAMRSALVLSASDGGSISLLEVMQNYPTRQIHVDGNQAVAAYRQISTIQQRADSIRRGLSGILETLGVP
jgi:hypothetical protein